MPPRLSPLAIVLLLGCGHTDPFSNPSSGTGRPFDPGPPARLTVNPGPDRSPAWLADGSGVLYSVQDPGRSDGDVCLALLPAAGGQQSDLWCDVPDGAERTDAVLSAGPGPDGRLAFLAASTSRNNSVPELLSVRIAPTTDPRGGAEVRRLPYARGPGIVNAVGRLRWAGPRRLLYLGQWSRVREICPEPFVCIGTDTTVASLDVELLDLDNPTAIPSVVPGTERASGLAPASDGAEALYTLPGDSRIYRRALATGAVTVAYDFGSQGIARDLDAAGTRVVAVVGGVVGQTVDPDLGPLQWDSGGVLHLVDLTDGGDTPLDNAGRLYRRPALSPAGDRVVAEGYALSLETRIDPVTRQSVLDTIVSPDSDLFRYGGP